MQYLICMFKKAKYFENETKYWETKNEFSPILFYQDKDCIHDFPIVVGL